MPKNKVFSTIFLILSHNNNGILVYAGGDDVFAFLPLNYALKCAQEIKNAYLAAFSDTAVARDATISAAIVYSHMNTDLRMVARDAHKLLDDVAKRETGRNAFAIRVWKGGGPVITFSKPWHGILPNWPQEIDELKESYEKGEYSSGFFYRLEELLEILNYRDFNDTQKAEDFNKEQKEQLLTAEYMKNRDQQSKKVTLEEAKKRVQRILRLCMQEYRDDTKTKTGDLSVDGAMLLRFLKQKEV